jgi:ABC-type spermidine/putrescine transport system permease subunit I
VQARTYVAGRLVAPGVAAVAVFFSCLGIMAYYSFLPSLGIAKVGTGFTLVNYEAFIGDAFNLSYLWRSLRVATYTTAIVLLMGYTIAYFMSFCSPRTRTVISVVLLVQFFTSYVVRTYAIVLVLGRYGIVNETLQALGITEAPIKLLFNEFAVALGIVLVAVPFMVFPIYSSLAAIPPNLLTAAESLGATRFKIFTEVILPMSMPGVAAGVVIVYLFNFTSFITPSLLGGGYFDMIANLIYDQAMNTQQYPVAAATSMIALVLTILIVYAMQKAFAQMIRGTER